MQRKIIWTLLMWGIIPTAAMTAFSQDADARRWHLLAESEIYLPTNAADGINDSVQQLSQGLNGSGWTATPYLTTSAGYGGRLGFFYDLTDILSVGSSLGYISGPETSGSIFFAQNGPPYGYATLNEDWTSSYTRWMFEGILGKPRSDSPTPILRTGAGIAWGNLNRTTTCSGPSCSPVANASASWSGFTWEISPALAWYGWIIGYRYASFPTFNGTAALSKMAWSTSGFYTSYFF